jgi:hypothetical protein
MNARADNLQTVGVGIMIAHNPLHGSGQAGFPHAALALGNDAHAAQGIGMTDGRRRQPASDKAPHTVPKDAAILAAPRQRAIPEASHLGTKDPQRVVVHGHPVISDVSTHHRLQPLSYNASTPPLRAAPHDSGPMWVATPLSYDSFIHYTSPVLTGAQGAKRWA